MKTIAEIDDEIIELRKQRTRLQEERGRALEEIRKLILTHGITPAELRPIFKQGRLRARGSEMDARTTEAVEQSFPYLA